MDEQQNIIIYRTADGRASVALYAKDGKIWLSQQQMAELFATSKQAISYHIINILKEKELKEKSVVKEYLTTAADGKNYNVVFYSLEMIIAVGYRVRGLRGTQFRQWATEHLTEYLVKGFTMDDERLKNPDGRPDYFDELLSRIRDIRASEKRFYQKVRDLFKLSSDYDKTDKADADPKIPRHRLKNEGNETVTNCNQLKLQAEDGKMRKTEYKKFKGLKKENLRDNMTNRELLTTEVERMLNLIIIKT